MERNSTQTHITGHFIDGPFQAINCTGIELTPKIHENTQNANSKIYRLIIVKKKTCKQTYTETWAWALKSKPTAMHDIARTIKGVVERQHEKIS